MQDVKKWETDLLTIQEIVAAEQDENWEFRKFLKKRRGVRVDRLVHRLYAEVAAGIDCTACGNCCRIVSPSFAVMDMERFASGLGLTVAEFQDRFLVEDEERPGEYIFREKPCPFLRENRCLHYDYRTRDCRSFPHLHKRGFQQRLVMAMENVFFCPIVFHVWQRLKSYYKFKKNRTKRRKGD